MAELSVFQATVVGVLSMMNQETQMVDDLARMWTSLSLLKMEGDELEIKN
jgi:hypothetical protein